MSRLQKKTFEFRGGDAFTLHLMPNDEGGTRNAYLGLYDEEGFYRGSIDGKTLAKLAKALRPYEKAELEPSLAGGHP